MHGQQRTGPPWGRLSQGLKLALDAGLDAGLPNRRAPSGGLPLRGRAFHRSIRAGTGTTKFDETEI